LREKIRKFSFIKKKFRIKIFEKLRQHKSLKLCFDMNSDTFEKICELKIESTLDSLSFIDDSKVKEV
jgi:hypothetical protein